MKSRKSHIAICLLLSVVMTALFGISLRGFFNDITAPQAAGQMLLMAGTGWVIQILLAAAFMKGKALNYTGHLASIMVMGLLMLTPWMLFYFLAGIRNIYLPAVSVLLSSSYMLYLHVQRTKYLEISQGWTVSWFLLLQSTAFFWIYHFHLK